jgi:phosphatidylinositol glycan class V
MDSSLVPRRHRRSLLLVTLLSRLITFTLLHASARLLPLFDSAPRLVAVSSWTQPLLRWDEFHFLHIAHHGYTYENQWAFFPGAPLLMRFSAFLLSLLPGVSTHPDLLLAGATAALACDGTRTLYDLSLHHLRSPHLALLTALLSLIPSSPATLHFTPCSEPFFTFLSYKGVPCPSPHCNPA